MRRLLRRLDDPHLDLGVIHVAGTKGKGSTAAMLAAALTASRVRTGLYCSPHLHRLEERFDDRRQSGLHVRAGRPCRRGQRGRRSSRAGGFAACRVGFDVFRDHGTAMELLYFARRGAQVVVLEVGMGGRLDSTNIVHPILSIITSISFDHTRQLGNTLASITARESRNSQTRPPRSERSTRPRGGQAIRRVARQRFSPLRELDTDYWFDAIPPEPPRTPPHHGVRPLRGPGEPTGENSACRCSVLTSA